MEDCLHRWGKIWMKKNDQGERVWFRKCWSCKRIEKTKSVRLEQTAGSFPGCIQQEEIPNFNQCIHWYQT